MSWLRYHAFEIQEKNSPTASQTIFRIISWKDKIGADLERLFTYFNDFQDLYFLQDIDLEREYSFNYPDTLLTSKEQQHLINEINRFFQALSQETQQMWATLISPSTDITLWDEKNMEEYGDTLATWAKNAMQDVQKYQDCQEYDFDQCGEDALIAVLLVKRTLLYALKHDLNLVYRTW
ncbi:hypothetical protein QTA56_05155 [Acinetobacter sp. VNH17]|uniref:Uncharacterized protein n=1 Tax=Acinetobacter thutiue TaxID=2998078 RepID=A0ABT7WLT2_9GAMM|nr:hypothetical protein [Acinetobacter thutiue]MCY6411529.1 hypothetical protein [Acinetobacter thutiue]MDN0013631.1 hypothetical protein [Acinetobacter thutiue]